MKQFKCLIIFLLTFTYQGNIYASPGAYVYANINGMTCQFCAYGLQKALNKLPEVKRAQVSLARKQARVQLAQGVKLSLQVTRKIRHAIRAAGYTPGQIKQGK